MKEQEMKKHGRRLPVFLLALLVFVIAAAGIAYGIFQAGTGAVSEDSSEIIVSIENGSGYYQIIDTLDEAGLIRNKTAAKLYVKLFAPDNLQANTYILNQNMDLKTMLDIISTGNFQYLLKTKFTVVEGSTIPDAAAHVADALGMKQNQVLKVWDDRNYLRELIGEYWFLTDEILDPAILYPLEGYLYPETYFVADQDPDVETVTRYCLDMMGKKLEPYRNRISELGMSVHEFLALASVVQDESFHPEDYKKIAGVFFNRLKKGMPLQSDSTVLYALQEKRINVTYADLEVDSPYNTYQYAGVPVGPICAVQEEILDACANYEENDNYYFFACEDGTVLYSKTLDEHNQKVKDNLWY